MFEREILDDICSWRGLLVKFITAVSNGKKDKEGEPVFPVKASCLYFCILSLARSRVGLESRL